MTNLKRVATLFMIAMLALTAFTGAFAGSAAAQTTTLAGDGTDHVTDFNASDSDHLEYTLNADGTDFSADGTSTVSLNITHDGHEYTVTSSDVDGSSTSYTFNVSHAELKKLPGDAGQNTTVNVTAWGENVDGNVTTSADEFQTDIQFADTHAVRHVRDADSQAIADYEEDEGWFDFTTDSHATIEDTIGVNGTNTEAQVYVDDSNVSDEFDASIEDADAGDRLALMMSSTESGELIYVFNEEPGETIEGDDVTSTDHTYVVVHNNSHATIHSGDDTANELDVKLVANDAPGMSALQEDLDYGPLQALGVLKFALPFAVVGTGGAVAMSTGLVVTRRSLWE